MHLPLQLIQCILRGGQGLQVNSEKSSFNWGSRQLIKQQAKIALARLANGNDDRHQKMFGEFATYITRSKHDNSNERDVSQLLGYKNDETVRAADVVRQL